MIALFDSVLDIVDSLTFNLKRISPSMWPVFELIYKAFKSDAIDFLDGVCRVFHPSSMLIYVHRNATFFG